MENVKRRLINKLKEFYPDRDFVIGVISDVEHEEDQQTILDFMENEKDITAEDIILLSLYLGDKRENKQWTKDLESRMETKSG